MLRSILAMMAVVCIVGAQECSVCPLNTISEPGSYDVTACHCKTGWCGPNGGPCEQCDIGKYETVALPHISTPCPSTSGGSPTGNMGVYVWIFVCISTVCFVGMTQP